jgi:GT2 family glycosyltransferase
VLECLEALAAQDPPADVLVVASGLDPQRTADLEEGTRAILPEARTVREPRPGLSRARNRALAACADDEVVVYIDDDVIVPPGWLRALHDAWSAAPVDVACLGGPIRPRYPGDAPPAWLSDPLLPSLCALDYGGAPLDLDPRVRTVYGGNVGFRCGPLRAVGGFDPAWGHRDGRVWFSEEDEAQRALHRAGRRIAYVPSAWVWHAIPPAHLRRAFFVRRRFRYGASLGARGARSRALALRQALSSAAGAPVAALQGDDRLAMERAVRAAENAGVLLASLVARR